MQMRLALALLLLILAGCGVQTRLHGNVTIDEQPLNDGSISFEPADGAGPSFGAAIKDGQYEISNQSPLTPGKKRVRIRGSVKTGKQIPAGPPHPPSTMIDEVQYFPAAGAEEKYEEAEVVADQDNQLSFKLSK